MVVWRRMEALEERLAGAEAARKGVMKEKEQVKEQLDESQAMLRRQQAIIEAQKQAILQLQLALKKQEQAVETIFEVDPKDAGRCRYMICAYYIYTFDIHNPIICMHLIYVSIYLHTRVLSRTWSAASWRWSAPARP